MESFQSHLLPILDKFKNKINSVEIIDGHYTTIDDHFKNIYHGFRFQIETYFLVNKSQKDLVENISNIYQNWMKKEIENRYLYLELKQKSLVI